MSKILFVTDNAEKISSLVNYIQSKGYVTDIAISGAEALERATSGQPNLVIINDFKENINAFEHQMSRHEELSAIPFISIADSDIVSSDAVLSKIENALKPKKILIAEDDKQMSEVLKVVLENLKYDIKTTYDGVETLKTIKSWQPDLVVLDVMLPIMDGFHICKELSEGNYDLKRPKIIIVSGRDSNWDKNLGSACGAEAYITKPFSNSDFVKAVNEVIKS